jgi:molybdopterin/thiamine biosynthesis adenylyltransferase
MVGAEAVERAETLWRLSVEDPDALRKLEADAPDPQIANYAYEPDSAILMVDIDVTGHQRGYFRLGLAQSSPIRGAIAALGAGEPADAELPVAGQNWLYTGPVEVPGLWCRVSERPPGPELPSVTEWVQQYHSAMVEQAQVVAATSTRAQCGVGAVVGFVFLDEGPERDQWHDAWIFFVIGTDRSCRLVRGFRIDRGEHGIRQPQLAPLESKSVGLVGVGALGSQVAALMARAGLGAFYGVDPDIIAPGNRVRHEADLADVGAAKVAAVCRRLQRVNPYIKVDGSGVRLGAAGADDPGRQQVEQDTVAAEIAARDLIVNASAHYPTGAYVSALGDDADRPVLHVVVSSGARSGRVLLQRHGRSGCLECLARHQAEPVAGSPEVPVWTEDPDLPEVMEGGCAQASFTGPGFEITATATAAVRIAVQTLLEGDGYPAASFDLVTLTFRDDDTAEPSASYSRLPRHPACTSCTAAATAFAANSSAAPSAATPTAGRG